MPYYAQGDYYRGDYYRGDPGLFGAIKSIGKGILGGISKIAPIAMPGIGGVVGGIAGSILGGTKSTALVPASSGSLPVLRTPGLRGFGQRLIPGGATGYEVMVGGRRRRMNVANPKALRRALRRVSGFGKLAKRARRDIGRAASAVGVRRAVGRAKPFGRK